MHHYYIRHSEHEGDRLTDKGAQEAHSLRDRLRGMEFCPPEPNPDDALRGEVSRAWSADTFRSLATTALALTSPAAHHTLEQHVQHLMRTGVLHSDSRLRYTKFSKDDDAIRDAYQEAYDQGRTMEFYLHHSDDFLTNNPSLSTHRTLAAEVARRTLADLRGQMPRLVCTREFFWPNFRAAVFEDLGNRAERDRYIEWYCSEKERNPLARTDIAQVSSDGDQIVMQDDYGTLACSEETLRNIAERGGLHV